MPDNQLNTANDNLDKIVKLASEKKIDISTPDGFITFINMPEVAKLVRPYLITYDTIVTDDGDESYTYIDSDVLLNNQNINYHITGIKKDSEMYNISQSTLDIVNKDFYDNPGFVPIIVNKYAAENFKLSKGSIFSGVVNNDANRNFSNHTEHKVNYRVIDIIDSYNDAGFLTTQTVANQVLGLSTDAFNGIMSKNVNSSLLSSLPIYSPSGFYLATDTLTKGSV